MHTGTLAPTSTYKQLYLYEHLRKIDEPAGVSLSTGTYHWKNYLLNPRINPEKCEHQC
jgi:hypothetical protein